MFSNKSLVFPASIAVALLFVLLVFGNAKAETKAKAPNASPHSTMSPEMKKDMADMYQKMADCLKTEKSMQECHKDVMKDCPVAKATGHCPIMEGMMGKGAMKHGKMKGMNMDHSEDKQ